MLSFWERESLLHYDYIVVGSGIVGLNVAYQLRQRFPKASIAIFERGILPSGASTKNAGFACMGSATELLADLKTMSEDEVVALFELRKKGLERTRQMLGDKNINYAANGSFELLSQTELYALDEVSYLNQLLQPVSKTNAFEIDEAQIERAQFNATHFKSAIKNTLEGELHSGKLTRTLLSLVQQLEVDVRCGTAIHAIEETTHGVSVQCYCSVLKTKIDFSAKQVVLCSNAFSKQLFPELDVTPGRGQVLVTKPIKNLAFKGIYHMDEGYFYFREIEQRVLFGGGRNLDFKNEESYNFEVNELILADLKHKLKNHILPGVHFEIDYNWSGIMAFGSSKTKQAIVKPLSDRIYACVRMNGMGVAIGSELAYQIVQQIKS